MKNILLELCAANQESIEVAAALSISRIELCSALELGGLTPSAAMMKYAKSKDLNVQVLIRPRPGDFIYTKDEVDIMREEVRVCKSIGVDGVVIGFQKNNGKLDLELYKEFVNLASPMELTSHRVFDRLDDQIEAVEQLIDCGVKRILTSGGKPTAYEGKTNLKRINEKADGRIQILAASGIKPENAISIVTETNIQQLHFSASSAVSYPIEVAAMDKENVRSSAKQNISYYRSDYETIRKMKAIFS